MKIRPLADHVVVKAAEAIETTKGGLILPGSAKEKPEMATVVAVGDGATADGKEIKMSVKVGDTVIVAKYAGTEVKCDGEEYNIVKISDILAIIEQ